VIHHLPSCLSSRPKTMNTAATPDPDDVRQALRQVMDPEVGMNIVDLGLVYRIDCTPGAVHVDMTMTSPACPLGDMIVDEAHAALDAVLSADIQIRIDLVWEPPWSPDKMAVEARDHFGWGQ